MQKHMAANYVSLLKHYEFMADYHKELKGYEAYGESAKFLNSLGLEEAVQDYIKHQAWGTPSRFSTSLKRERKSSAISSGTRSPVLPGFHLMKLKTA